MASGSNVDMLPTLGDALPGSSGNLEDVLQNELELILQAKRSKQAIGGQREMNRYRSGSAPPTVDGSLNAIGGLFGTYASGDVKGIGNFGSNNGMLSEEEIRSHPSYLAYYYSHENINPRLPPPLLSKEDWRVAQRFQASGSLLGGIEDWRREKVVDEGESASLFSMQPTFPVKQPEDVVTALRDAGGRNTSERVLTDWLGRSSDGMIGLSGPALGSRRRSFADILQDGSDCPASSSSQLSRSPSCNTFNSSLDNQAGFFNELESGKSLQSGHLGIQSLGTDRSHSFASSVGSSLSRSKTPEQQLLWRSASSGLPPVGSKGSPAEKKNIVGSSIQNGHSSALNELAEIAAALSGLKLEKTGPTEENFHVSGYAVNADNQLTFCLPNGHTQSLQQQLIDQSNVERFTSSAEYLNFVAKNGIMPNFTAPNVRSNEQVRIPKRTSSSANLYSKVHSSALADSEESTVFHLNENFPSRNTAYPDQILDSVVNGQLYAGSSLGSNSDLQRLNSMRKKGSDIHSSTMDARYIQFLQRVSESGLLEEPSPDPIFGGTSFMDADQLQKAYIAALAAQQKQQFELPLLGKTGGLNQGIYGNASCGLGMPYLGKHMPTSLFPSSNFGHAQNERIARFNSMMRSSIGTCYPDANHLNGTFISSLLDEFKTNKTRSFELSDIIGHVVEFSMDQYGSRFIQQKLETATEEEKIKISPEILPHARTLMRDVFGNYVIQKFFEHGTESQRAELASQLTGHVLPLSLQMYGCRVIQKALEVVDLDQQTCMVKELDGSVMKCVRDQNGNHVIQKCIECVPQDQIQFIISAFYGQVVALSTHPYGCRVIQRVLEHCNDRETQQIVMDEIMQSVFSLAQDQYGNYVIQHVLEHGKPSERSAIISKLAGQIVKMSQQKFASNVVEKCLTFGGPEERKLLVDEMLGLTDENEPLQAMMKDPFGNYVVQKVLETCDDLSLQLILSRIKIHLNTLKKYTYGKHIVSRVEKLIAAGERRIMLSSYTY